MSKTPELPVEIIKIRAAGRDAEQISVNYHLGHTLAELVGQFSETVVAAKAHEKIIINLQDYLRTNAKKGVDGAALQVLADKWVPGMRAPGKSKADKAAAIFDQMGKEEQAAFIAQLTKK